MVSPRDRLFLQGLGGKKVNTPADEIAQSKPSTLADRLLKKKEEIIEAKLVLNELGTDLDHKPAPQPQHETLAASIVSTSMNMAKDINKELREQLDSTRKDLNKAIEEKDAARAEALQRQIALLAESQQRLEQALKDVKTSTSRSAISELKEAKALLDSVKEGFADEKRTPAPSTPAMSPDLQITLMKMQHDHEIAMKNIELQIANANRDWQLRLAEFQDNKEQRMREYQDKLKFRNDSINSLQDLLAALGGNITSEREAEAIASSSAPEYNAKAIKFPCQFCQSPISITPGVPKATCDQCAAEYQIESKV